CATHWRAQHGHPARSRPDSGGDRRPADSRRGAPGCRPQHHRQWGRRMNMQALICDEFGPIDSSIRLGQCAAPNAPGPDDVIVDVAYASVSHAMGLMIEGRYQTRPPRPFIPGTEAVGTVVSCGANVTRLAPGDRVVAVAK